MDEYIERRTALKRIQEASMINSHNDDQFYSFHLAKQAVRETPSADVVPVVRCRDCKFHYREQDPGSGKTEHFCRIHHAEVSRDFFCSWGKRGD